MKIEESNNEMKLLELGTMIYPVEELIIEVREITAQELLRALIMIKIQRDQKKV